MKVVLEKTDPLIDEPVSVRLIGAPLRQVVRLRAESVDSRGIAFRSWADYEAGVDGTIVAARHSPRAGTYRGADAFGLWWSMASDPEQRFARDLRPVLTTIVAEVGHEQVARVDFERMRIAPGVSVEKVREGGLVATLFLPVTHLPAPGVMVLGDPKVESGWPRSWPRCLHPTASQAWHWRTLPPGACLPFLPRCQ